MTVGPPNNLSGVPRTPGSTAKSVCRTAAQSATRTHSHAAYLGVLAGEGGSPGGRASDGSATSAVARISITIAAIVNAALSVMPDRS
jgi:hypothetical protein